MQAKCAFNPVKVLKMVSHVIKNDRRGSPKALLFRKHDLLHVA